MNDYKSAFNAAAADLSAIIALLGFTKYPGVDPVLRAITDLILEKAENQVLREERDAANKRADTLEHRMMGMMTRHFAEAWRNRDTQKALDGYLSAGIAQLEQERDAAQARVAELEMLLRKLSANGLMQFSTADEEKAVRAALSGAQAQHSAPEVSGIGRDTGHPRAVVLYLRKEPTDDDLRAIHDALRSLAAAPGKEVPQAWLDVQAERRRQITAEGWTPEHDDLYCAAELPRAAAAYILNGANDEAPAIWPFSAKWWKPRDARSNYVRAGALILAEIERLDRAAPGKEGA
ncbi:Uncharacterised protein [Pseudomonas aeruginosa]|uniref:hypothetical protein n=1 Tax=Pseudomonas aeruginosa TaxID=287 RepID=UPI000AC21FF6|nr:hypothetical protein [Pseudomonas aeruginosa]SUC58847.1 Uncharacterised protein [Pseudomonas aeruginosa]